MRKIVPILQAIGTIGPDVSGIQSLTMF